MYVDSYTEEVPEIVYETKQVIIKGNAEHFNTPILGKTYTAASDSLIKMLRQLQTYWPDCKLTITEKPPYKFTGFMWDAIFQKEAE